jgi:hypothetical protein
MRSSDPRVAVAFGSGIASVSIAMYFDPWSKSLYRTDIVNHKRYRSHKKEENHAL